MDIHKPKPVHSWREFLSEIGVIVCGVLIALGLEQAVEALHWAGRVQEAKVSIHQQLLLASVFAEEQQGRKGCADLYLADLASAIVASPPQWTPRPTTYCGQTHDGVYSGIYRPWPTELWRSIEAEGVVSHLGSYGGGAAFIFDFIKKTGDLAMEEDSTAPQLEPLAYPIALTPEAKIAFLKVIADLRQKNSLLVILSTQLHGQIRSLGEAPTALELKHMRATVPGYFPGPSAAGAPTRP